MTTPINPKPTTVPTPSPTHDSKNAGRNAGDGVRMPSNDPSAPRSDPSSGPGRDPTKVDLDPTRKAPSAKLPPARPVAIPTAVTPTSPVQPASKPSTVPHDPSAERSVDERKAAQSNSRANEKKSGC